MGRDIVARHAGSPDFAPQVGLLERLAPHLGAGLKAATLRAQAATEYDNAPGVLTLDRSGRVEQHTPAAERLLRELGDLRPGWREGAGLPAAVRMVAGALKRALRSETDGDRNGVVPSLHVWARSRRWLTLHGSLSEPSGGLPGRTVIVVGRPGRRRWPGSTSPPTV